MKQDDPGPQRTWSKRRLQGYTCWLCEQTLDQAQAGNCGSIYDSRGCHWVKALKPHTQASEGGKHG